jgi:SAM-dependent methyltransferase
MATDVGGEWNRDAAYHPWIVTAAAEHAGDVLDVGCGDGLLVQRLAEVSRSVVGIDRDPVAIAQARKRLRMTPNTDAAVSEFGSEWGLTPESYDVITMVSVLHELPLVPTLERVAELLKPGGTLLVVGQTAPVSVVDQALEWASVPYASAVEAFYTWRGIYRPEFVSARPVTPTYSLVDVTDAAAELLPGAEVRRGLLGRYRLRWAKPVPVAGADEVGAVVVGATSAVTTGADSGAGSRGEASVAPESDARILDADAVDELSHLFDQTREVPTVEPSGEVPGEVPPGGAPDARRTA